MSTSQPSVVSAATVLAGLIVASVMTAVPATAARGVTGPFPGAGSTITVTTTRDELNRDGDCSLREAVEAANRDARVDRCTAGSGRDLIVVPAGVYKLTRVGARESDNQTGDLDIRRSVSLVGQGFGATVLDGFGRDRLLDIFAPAAVTVEGVTLRHGEPGAGRRGGAIVVLDGASLRLRHALVAENATTDGPDRIPDGGAIYNDGVMTIAGSVIRDNVAGGMEGSGGGIWNSGRLTLIDTTVSGNVAAGRDPASHAIDGGGGLFNRGVLVVRASVIRGNHSAWQGGGIANRRTMTIVDSSIEENSAGSGGGGIVNTVGSVRLEGTTVTGNTAAKSGGGIRNVRGTVTLDPTTSVSGNTPDDCFGTTAC